MRLNDSLPAFLKAEVELVRQWGAEIREEVIRPNVHRWERDLQDGILTEPTELLNELNRRQIFSAWIPRFLGGGGLSPLSYLVFSEELAEGCLGISNVVGAHYMGISLLSATDHLSVLRKVVADIRAGEKAQSPALIAVAVTEPDAGTDLEDLNLFPKARVQTTLRPSKGGYRLNGTKQFISNSPYAKWLAVTAFEDVRTPHESVAVVAIRRDTKGIKVGTAEKKMGQHICPAASVFFDDVQVPSSQVALSRSQFKNKEHFRLTSECLLYDVVTMGRLGVAIMAYGAMKSVQSWALQTAKQKNLFNDEWIQQRLAQMVMRQESVQRLVWSVAQELTLEGVYRDMHGRTFSWLDRSGVAKGIGLFSKPLLNSLRAHRRQVVELKDRERASGLASTVKVTATEALCENIHVARELFGLDACRVEGGLEKTFRDAKLLQIYEGANLINEINVFNQLLGPKFQNFVAYQEGP